MHEISVNSIILMALGYLSFLWVYWVAVSASGISLIKRGSVLIAFILASTIIPLLYHSLNK